MRKLFKIILIAIVFLFAMLLLFLAYITFIERGLLTVRRDKIVFENNGDKINIVQFSDTHLGEYYDLEDLKKAVKQINKLNPDIVVFTGDLIDNASIYESRNDISEVLKEIEASIGKYAIYGNHDIGGGAIRFYENIMTESGFKVLKNESEEILINGKCVKVFGGEDALLGSHNASETMKDIDEESINLLLIHEPDLIDEYKNFPVDLALSGHSHGGQVYIPFYGPIKKNALSEKYNKGIYEIENIRKTKLYVSSGLGNTKVPFRFFNVPEIKLFELYM